MELTFQIVERHNEHLLDPEAFATRFTRAAVDRLGPMVNALVTAEAERLTRARVRGGGEVVTGDGRAPYLRSFVSTVETFGPRAAFTVRNTAPGAYFMERGRGPGRMPPDAPIRAWMRAHGDLTLKQRVIDSAVFLVRRAIGRRGTRGKYVFRDTRQLLADGRTGRLVRAELGRELWRA